MKVAVVDIGSNTAHMCVFYAPVEGGVQKVNRLFKVKRNLGLASYLTDDGVITDEGIDSCKSAVEELVNIARLTHVDRLCLFATAAIRQAKNREQILLAIKECCGVEVEVLSGDQEALMGFEAVNIELGLDQGVLTDIGGGSTELIGFASGTPKQMASLPVGSLRLFRKYVKDLIPSSEECRQMQKAMNSYFDDGDVLSCESTDKLYAIGGTARATLKLLKKEDVQVWDNNTFLVSDLEEYIEKLVSNRSFAINAITRVCPDRIHTVIPGMIALFSIARRIEAERIVIGSYGVREGYLLTRVFTDAQEACK